MYSMERAQGQASCSLARALAPAWLAEQAMSPRWASTSPSLKWVNNPGPALPGGKLQGANQPVLLAGTGWGNGRAVSCQLGGVSAPVRLPASPCPEGGSPAGLWVPGPGTLPSPELQSHMRLGPTRLPSLPSRLGADGPWAGDDVETESGSPRSTGSLLLSQSRGGARPGCQCVYELGRIDWMGLIKAGCPGSLNPRSQLPLPPPR